MKSGWGLSAWTVDSEDSEGSVPMRGLRLKTESGSSANWGKFPMDDRPWRSCAVGTVGIEFCRETGIVGRGGSGIEYERCTD